MATNKCSYPNPADDVRSRVTYSAAAEIIYRLDTYLKNESRSSTGGSPPADIIRSVFQCAMAAVQVLAALDATWMDNKPMLSLIHI